MSKASVVRVALGAVAIIAAASSASAQLQYHALTPCRVVDTRNPNGAYGGPIMTSNQTRNFTVTGVCGVPSGADAVTINLTAVSPTNRGHVRLWPQGGTMPNVSTLNYAGGETAIANGAIVPLSVGGGLSVFTFLSPSGNVHIVIDITGYFDN